MRFFVLEILILKWLTNFKVVYFRLRNSQDLGMGGLAHAHISPAHHCSKSQKCAHVPCSTQHGYSMEINSHVPQRPTNPQNITHRIHVWYIYLHLVDSYGKCRQIYPTWILWVIIPFPLFLFWFVLLPDLLQSEVTRTKFTIFGGHLVWEKSPTLK